MSQFLSFLLILALSASAARASVPASATFKLVNEGEFGAYIVEYDGNYRALNLFTSPFQLCFYNTTPNAYTLALRIGLKRSESRFFWVWEANRANPVKENATFSLGTDGNLVLADSDGRIAWQSDTANKGVVGFDLLPNGNMVLLDAKGSFVWQSFDTPGDTLLVGQYLRPNGPSKLVSRISAQVNANGPYSFVLEPRRYALYYKANSSPKPLLYFAQDIISKSSLTNLTFDVSEETDDEGPYAYDITFGYASQDGQFSGSIEIARPKYNATLSFLRLGLDGNLKVYTYNTRVDWAAWEATFTLMSRDSPYGLVDTECQLPERCGALGVCEDSQCVACPTPTGLLGWSKSCKAPVIGKCQGKDAKYFKVEGVDHYLEKYTRGNGPLKESECGNKCTKDCKCLGYFYNEGSSRCWIAYDLKTLTKVDNSTHVGYIKISG